MTQTTLLLGITGFSMVLAKSAITLVIMLPTGSSTVLLSDSGIELGSVR